MTTNINEIASSLFSSATGNIWKRLGVRHRHGIALPLSALRTKNSSGIGEFLDLIPLIDWCSKLKIDLIQLLPLYDTGGDTSPYNALSACALNPLFLSLHALPYLDRCPALKEQLSTFASWNETPRVSYSLVLSQKLSWLRAYFQEVEASITETQEFRDYLSACPWIETYALFKALKDVENQKAWTDWHDPFKQPTPAEYKNLVKEYKKEISFYIALQYLCYLQLKQVSSYASSHNVLLKGDMPILICKDSADVWHNPSIFNLTLSAGAPPDFLNPDGQYWGFPLFKWEVKKLDGYSWWKQRLSCASHFYHLFRIDHVVGFFRIWGIPLDKPSSEGGFVPKDPLTWIPQGKELLEMMIAASPMLPLAEDLGTVPKEVRACLTELGICGTKVIRWERLWETDKSFIPFSSYSPISLTTLSTHDSETLEIWWRENKEEASAFAAFKKWTYAPELTLSQRKEILWDSHHTASLFHINLLQEYLALFPELVSPNPEEERINIPGKILPNNWTYRFRPTLEEITAHEPLQKAMQEILFSSTPNLK